MGPHTRLIFSPRLKYKIDRYIRRVNIANFVLFAKGSNVIIPVRYIIGTVGDTAYVNNVVQNAVHLLGISTFYSLTSSNMRQLDF